MDNKEEKLSDALLKVALGFQVSETVEEYADVDGALKLTKRKKTKKDVPPDLKAVQILLCEAEKGSVSTMSDEELQAEKGRLLRLLEETQKISEKGEHVCVEREKTTEKTVKKPKTARAKPRKRVVRKINKEKKE